MTRLLEKKADTLGGAQHALRRYVVARAAGREFGEWTKWDPDIKAWVFCTEIEAQGQIAHAIRRPGEPWCTWLGPHTEIAEDLALSAYFEVHASEDSGWTFLRGKVQRNPAKAFMDFRREGRERLERARALREHPDIKPKSSLLEKLALPGKGPRSLKKAKRG